MNKSKKQIVFHEVYGSYYQVVAEILASAVKGTLDRQKLEAIIREKAFEESSLTITDHFLMTEWPFLTKDYKTSIRKAPKMPLTLLEKRWLKTMLMDRRIRLFYDEPMPEAFAEIQPLFTEQTVIYYDRYTDGDPYEDSRYIITLKKSLPQ